MLSELPSLSKVSISKLAEPANDLSGDPSKSTGKKKRRRRPGKHWQKSDASEPPQKRQALAPDVITNDFQDAIPSTLPLSLGVAPLSDTCTSTQVTSSSETLGVPPPPTGPPPFIPPPPPPPSSLLRLSTPLAPSLLSLPTPASPLLNSPAARASGTSHLACIDSSLPAKLTAHSSSECSLQKSSATPGFPDSHVYAFIATLAPTAPDLALDILYTLGVARITSQDDLVAFADLTLRRLPEARNIMLQAGMSLIEWAALRQHLRGLDPDGHIEDVKWQRDRRLDDFCAACQPTLEHQVLPLIMLGFVYDEVEFLAETPSLWPDTVKYLRINMFSYPEALSFKRGLRKLAGVVAPPADKSLVDFFSTLPGPVKGKMEIVLSSGIDSPEDLDVMCRLPDEQLDEVMEGLSTAGLTFSECGAFLTGLQSLRKGLENLSSAQ
ncbi:hypothetical protein EIP91_002678 [Steccherinum ochraceum]|uniref:Uncharacterized protein n=1 Tax=Steccherinum ochraceum TaxID=92696 RepID=A0A4R0RDJ6_9APHY|nr:hypothetical protein EIP91_002678 [Steccherinum ochraceum]